MSKVQGVGGESDEIAEKKLKDNEKKIVVP